jgi:hypothetical protein
MLQTTKSNPKFEKFAFPAALHYAHTMAEHEPLPFSGSQTAGPTLPPADELQFHTAQPVGGDTPAPGDRCAVCKAAIVDEYFHAQGHIVCPLCASRIESGQQAPPHLSLVPALIYGGAAAFAGFLIYALVGIFTGLEIGLVAILIGYMVGKAIRHASKGMGGRPQQILAVTLTYFAITTSYIPLAIYHSAKERPAKSEAAASSQPAPMGAGQVVLMLAGLALAAPFLELANNFVSGAISLFIIIIGLRQAWALTGRTELLLMGPYRRSEG